jgi:hypothetical protein
MLGFEQPGVGCGVQQVPEPVVPQLPQPKLFTSATHVWSQLLVQQYESIAHTHELIDELLQVGVG